MKLRLPIFVGATQVVVSLTAILMLILVAEFAYMVHVVWPHVYLFPVGH
jgi:hypothetical protein